MTQLKTTHGAIVLMATALAGLVACATTTSSSSGDVQSPPPTHSATDDVQEMDTSLEDIGEPEMQTASAEPTSTLAADGVGEPVDVTPIEPESSGIRSNPETDAAEVERPPLTLSPETRRAVLSELEPQIQRCARVDDVTVTAELQVAPNGVVQSALVTGEPLEATPQARCMEAALKDAEFPPFRERQLVFDYTYRL